MNQKELEIEWVDPSALQKNPWNTNIVSPENETKIEESLDRFGVFKPILVRQLDDGQLEILGGEHRTEAARRKGMETVPIINLGLLDDTKAKEIGLIDNGRYGSDDALKLADLLTSLDDHDLASFLPYSDGELETLFSSTSIALDELDCDEDDDEPELPPSAPTVQTHQVMRFKVPVEDADAVMDVMEKIMKEQDFTDSDSLTNVGDALVFLCKGQEEEDHG